LILLKEILSSLSLTRILSVYLNTYWLKLGKIFLF